MASELKPCPCKPHEEKCMFEEHKENLIGCSARILHYHFQELKRQIPIIGGWFEEYQCPFFLRMEQEGKQWLITR